ncbi:uncharacterized protein LOC142981090 [Anticarsia gemmatalis]|uniref:uncharacterized protein LOC142981090 n=1 Tax=Anticarsia gemmatalis TaxID=129554 RepID=UPI003F776CA5
MEMKEISAVQAAALDNELCLLVNEQDAITGSATKRECHKIGPDGSLLLHRAFSVLLFNSAGELLVQKRASQKVTYPDCFTNSCCSHPLLINSQPEDVITAAIRRLNTELGIPSEQLKREDFTLIGRILYMDTGDGVWGEHELDYVLIIQRDVDVTPNPDEIAEIQYISKDNFDSFMDNLKVTPWFKLLHQHLMRHWWDNLHRLQDIAKPHNIHSFIDIK